MGRPIEAEMRGVVARKYRRMDRLARGVDGGCVPQPPLRENGRVMRRSIFRYLVGLCVALGCLRAPVEERFFMRVT
jgi:hypothetical protein